MPPNFELYQNPNKYDMTYGIDSDRTLVTASDTPVHYISITAGSPFILTIPDGEVDGQLLTISMPYQSSPELTDTVDIIPTTRSVNFVSVTLQQPQFVTLQWKKPTTLSDPLKCWTVHSTNGIVNEA